MDNLQPIVSSNLDAAGYDPATRELVVKFKNGSSFKYKRVVPALWKKFQAEFDGTNGRSAGKFFAQHIRGLENEKI